MAAASRLWTALRRSRGRPRGLPGRGGFLALLGLAFAIPFALAAFVTAVDPYGLYPWGAALKVDRDRYSHVGRPWVLNAVAEGDFDTVLIGGSTAEQFTGDDVAAGLTGTRRAFAAVWPGPGPTDLKLVMDRIGAAPAVERVLVSYDLSWILPPEAGNPVFPVELYDGDVTNDLNVVTPATLRLSWALATRGDYFIPDWEKRRIVALSMAKYRDGQSEERRGAYQASLDAYRAEVDRPTTRTCADFPSNAILADYARDLSARGKRLDIVIPPYSYVAYYDQMRPLRRWRYGTDSPMGLLLQSRRCLIAAVAGIDGVAVHGFDLEAWMVEDMVHYRDSTHLQGQGLGPWLLAAIDRGDHRLTVETFEPYASEMRRRVRTYELHNSGAGW